MRLVVKRYSEFGGDRVKKALLEFKALAALEAHDIPAPRPLYLDEHGSVLGAPGIVTAYVPGRQIKKPLEPKGWVRGLAAALAQIHSVNCEAAGLNFLLDGNAEATWFLRSGGVPDYMAAHPDGAALWGAVRDLLPTIQRVQPALVHLDYWRGNVLWRRGRIAAIFDWEEPSYGDPAIDVAYCRMDLFVMGMGRIANEFLKAYESEIGRPVENLGFWELAAAARPMANPADWLTKPSLRRNLRRFIANTRRGVGL
jgi:aminoglycoside phosphotransferase (APT) family kinase protein